MISEEEKERQREAKRRRTEERKREAWEKAGYVSCNVDLPEGEISTEDEDAFPLQYVIGDVTQPYSVEDALSVIVMSVDASGTWGRGRLFESVAALSAAVPAQYEMAKKNKDLHMGDAHVVRVGDNKAVALCVSIKRKNNGSIGMDVESLGMALERVRCFCLEHHGTVHLPRIGEHASKSDWYACERRIQKCFKGRLQATMCVTLSLILMLVLLSCGCCTCITDTTFHGPDRPLRERLRQQLRSR